MRDELAEFDAREVETVMDQLLQMKKEGYLIANSITFLRHFKAFMCENKILPDGYRCLAGYSTVYVDTYENVLPCWSGGFGPVDNLQIIRCQISGTVRNTWSCAKRWKSVSAPAAGFCAPGSLQFLLMGKSSFIRLRGNRQYADKERGSYERIQ